MSAFKRALEIVLRFEGGSTTTNDPNDPGGLTKWGLSQKAYPNLDIEALTFEDAAALYRRDYWDVCQCDELPEPIALALFDSAVNQGPRTAIRLLQNALQHRPADGIMGPRTIMSARQVNAQGAITDYVEQRWDHYQGLSISRHFLRGWTRRLFRLQAECLWLAAAKQIGARSVSMEDW